MNDLILENIYKNNYNYVNTNYESLIKLQKGITLLKPQLTINDVFFVNQNGIFFKKFIVNANNPYSSNINEYIDIYGGLGITSNLFLDGKLNIYSDFNIDYTRQIAPLELKNILIHIGNSEIKGLTTIYNDFTINGDLINRKDLNILNDTLDDDYRIEKNIYGNIYKITNQVVTYNDIYCNTISGFNTIINANILNIPNVSVDFIQSNTAILSNIISLTTELDNLSDIGNLNLIELYITSIKTVSTTHGNVFATNLISNGSIILSNDLYTNILNTPSLNSDKLISNIVNSNIIYTENIRFNNLINLNPIQTAGVEAILVTASNSVAAQEIFTENAIFNGDVYINGLFNYIDVNVFSLVDSILTLNKPAIGIGSVRDSGIFHIYNNETEVPAVLYKRDKQTSISSPIRGLDDIVVFGNVNIKDLISGKPLSNIYFNNADVIGLHTVYMNSINGNINSNFVIGQNSYNIYLGNSYLYGNTSLNNLISNNLIINNSINIEILNSNIIYGNTLNFPIIKAPYGNLIINKLIVNNINTNRIESNNITTSIFQANILNIISTGNNNITANIVTNGFIQSNVLNTNDITTINDINIDGNLIITGNVNTNNLYIQNILEPTVVLTANTTIQTSIQNIIFQNENNSIFVTLNNSYIGDTKNFILNNFNAFPCYVITNNGTYYLNNSYSYLTLYYDGTKWFSLESTPIISQLNKKITANINSNIGKSLSMNYFGNVICAGGPDSDYGIVKFISNNGSNWIESNLISSKPFTKFGNPMVMSGDTNIIVSGCENEGNIFIYRNLSLVQDISLKYKPASIGVSYNGNVIAFGLNSVFGNIGCLHIYKYDGNSWVYKDSVLPENHIGCSSIGDAIDISINGDIIVFGGSGDNNNIGKVWLYNEIASSNVYVNYNNNNIVKTFYFDKDTANLYVGGNFTSIQTVSTIGGGLIDTTSNTVIKFGNVNGNVNSIAKYEGNIYYAGNFTNIDGIVANSIACWNGSTWNRLGNGIVGTINTISIGFGNIYVGGRFNLIDGQAFNNVAVWNINTSSWRNIGGINGEVKNILYHNQTVYIGGNFSSVNIISSPLAANNIASYNIDLNQWNRIQNGVNGNVEKIYQYKDEIYVAGSFTKYGDYNGNFGKIISNVVNINFIEKGPSISWWSDIALSENGKYISSGENFNNTGGNIYISSDYGLNWNKVNLFHRWEDISMSLTGQYQSACAISGNIFGSSDYGITWTQRTFVANSWVGIAVSGNGQYQAAVATNNNFLYTSYDYGITWIPRIRHASWSEISISNSGQYISACSFFSNLYVSSDFGINWTAKLISLNQFTSISISGTGQYQSACRRNGNIYTSQDYGNTWNATGPTFLWSSISISGSGEYQYAYSNNNAVLYRSIDYGLTWSFLQSISGAKDVAISPDGSYLFLGTNGSTIKISYPSYGIWENTGLSLNGPIYDIIGYDDYLLLGGLFSGGSSNFKIYITSNITYEVSYNISGNNIIKYNLNDKNTEELPFNISGAIRNVYYDDVMNRYYIGGDNLLYYHSGSSYQLDNTLSSNNYVGEARQGSYIKYKETEMLIGSKESNSYWKWTKYGDYWYDDNYNRNSYKITKFVASDNFKNIFTNSGNIIIQNQNIGTDYYDDFNIRLNESGNINGIGCNYNSSKLVAGINSNLYIYY